MRSSDNWFRPVNFVNAPDGTLYVLDMSREVIEAIHIPLDVVKHLNLKRGRDQGRIYRVAPPGFRFTSTPRLSQATTADLVAAMQSARTAGNATLPIKLDLRAAGSRGDRTAANDARPDRNAVSAVASECSLVARRPESSYGVGYSDRVE